MMEIVRLALEEDIGAGDVTGACVHPRWPAGARRVYRARASGVGGE